MSDEKPFIPPNQRKPFAWREGEEVLEFRCFIQHNKKENEWWFECMSPDASHNFKVGYDEGSIVTLVEKKHLAKLESENADLKDVLKFYANKYEQVHFAEIDEDPELGTFLNDDFESFNGPEFFGNFQGKRARQVLAKYK